MSINIYFDASSLNGETMKKICKLVACGTLVPGAPSSDSKEKAICLDLKSTM